MRNGLIGLVSAMVLTSTMATVGCGSNSSGAVGADGSSSSGSSVTTLSDTKALGALTAAEVTQLCKDVYSYFGREISMATACKYRGLADATSSSPPSDAQMQQVCKDHENACTQAGTGVGSADKPGCSDIPSTCTATVAEYSACIRDEVAVFNQGVSGLPSCATALSASMSAVWEVMVPGTPQASCDSLSNKCPALSQPVPNH